MKTSFNIIKKRREAGATLVVSLVILAIVTVLGLASMRNSNLELKMATSARDHTSALQNAESALRIIEQNMLEAPFTRGELETTLDGNPVCDIANDESCFNPGCVGGLCFNGEFTAYTKESACRLGKAANSLPQQMWKLTEIWETEGLTQVVEIPNSRDPAGTNAADFPPTEVQYLVEFMCFALRPNSTTGEYDRGFPLFRVTVRAEGELGRSEVVLQSVFRGAKLDYAQDEVAGI